MTPWGGSGANNPHFDKNYSVSIKSRRKAGYKCIIYVVSSVVACHRSPWITEVDYSVVSLAPAWTLMACSQCARRPFSPARLQLGWFPSPAAVLGGARSCRPLSGARQLAAPAESAPAQVQAAQRYRSRRGTATMVSVQTFRSRVHKSAISPILLFAVGAGYAPS